MGQEDIKAIDVMNYMFTPEVVKPMAEAREIKMMQPLTGGDPSGMFKGGMSAEQFIAEMDAAGIDKCFITALKLWSYSDRKMIWDIPIDKVYEVTKKYPDRLIGRVSYNPFRIKESLEEIDKAIKEYKFKGVYAHTLSFGIRPTDRRMYPCYAKCLELGVPFSLQIGHSLEPMPSEPGRPIYLDTIALDFPDLVIIGSHTGWPWCEEIISLAWKYPNIYVDTSAHLPRYLDKNLVQFMNTRGRKKTLFGTNGMPFGEIKKQFLELGLKEETNKAILRENAIRVYKL